jgi:hypothetical protein
MLKANSFAVGSVVFIAGCPLAVETNEQACVRANTKVLTCLAEAAGLPTSPGSSSALCATQTDTEDCNWRPIAQCVAAATCEELVTPPGGAGGAICQEFLSNLTGCPNLPHGL